LREKTRERSNFCAWSRAELEFYALRGAAKLYASPCTATTYESWEALKNNTKQKQANGRLVRTN
jgi:hypothetical protein